MFLSKLKAIVAIAAVTGFVVASASVLAQPGPNYPLRAGQNAVAPSLRFEIRTWRGGREAGEPITVEVAAGAIHQIETPDAVIEIRPRQRLDRAESHPEGTKTEALPRAPKPLQQLGDLAFPVKPSASAEKKGRNDDYLPNYPEKPEAVAPKPNSPTANNPLPELPKTELPSQRGTDQARRLDQLERKVDQILNALERAPWREENQPQQGAPPSTGSLPAKKQ
jgi:hypothetical protein